jgi:hypothetical protein
MLQDLQTSWNGTLKLKVLSLNPLNAELNPICHLLALAGAHHFVDVSRIRVKYFFCSILYKIYNFI